MTTQLISLAATACMMAFILYRQMVARRVTLRVMIVPAALLVIGALSIQTFLQGHAVGELDWITFGITLAISVALAFPRAFSYRIWRAEDGTTWGKGTWITLVLWLVTFGTRFAVGHVVSAITGQALNSGFQSVTIMLVLGISFTIQAAIRLQRSGAVKAALA